MTQTINNLIGTELRNAYRQVAAPDYEDRDEQYMRAAIAEAIRDGACTVADVIAWSK